MESSISVISLGMTASAMTIALPTSIAVQIKMTFAKKAMTPSGTDKLAYEESQRQTEREREREREREIGGEAHRGKTRACYLVS